jgi:hypothetical protein
MKKTTDKKEKIESPRFAFLKISTNAYLAHLPIYKAAQAIPQSKLCKRAKSSTPQQFQYLPVFCHTGVFLISNIPQNIVVLAKFGINAKNHRE